jgi:hypothetical protein
MSEWMTEWMDEWMNEWMNEWVNETHIWWMKSVCSIKLFLSNIVLLHADKSPAYRI